MVATIHVGRPAIFPNRCVRCMSADVHMRTFTDTADAVVVTVVSSLEIPVCDQCWKAPRRWWIGAGTLFFLFLASGVPFALAQDKHVSIPRVIPILILLLMAGFCACLFIARRRAPVKLVPTKIDRENIRITFFNPDYANEFVKANKETAKVINPWKFE